jgi:hypothetical protein
MNSNHIDMADFSNMEISWEYNISKFAPSKNESSNRPEGNPALKIVEELYKQIDLADKIEFLIIIMTRNCLDAEQAEQCMTNKKKNGWKMLIED